MTTNITTLRASLERLCIGNSSQYQSENSYVINCSSSNQSLSDDRRLFLAPFVNWIIGGIMIFIFVLGFCENVTVLLVYIRTPKLRTVNSVFVTGLSLSDLGQTVFNIPFVIISSFSRRWIFGHVGCMYIGCITTWFGISQISLLFVIAMDRYFIIVHGKRKYCKTVNKAYCTIVFCFIYGICFAIAPVLGWSEYKLVPGEISCSINWTDSNRHNLSFTLTLFVLVWFLPLSFIVYGYIRITMVVCTDRERRRKIKLSSNSRKNSRECKVAITVLLMVGAFVMSWTPYSVVALMSAFGDMRDASASVYLVPAAFAKASIIWNPIIYISRHKTFKQACSQAFKRNHRNQSVNESENKVSHQCRNRRCLNNQDYQNEHVMNKSKPLLRHQSSFWSSDCGSYFKDSLKSTLNNSEVIEADVTALRRNKLSYISVESTRLESIVIDIDDAASLEPVFQESDEQPNENTNFLDKNAYLSSVHKLSLLQKRKVSMHQNDHSNNVLIGIITKPSEEKCSASSPKKSTTFKYSHAGEKADIDISKYDQTIKSKISSTVCSNRRRDTLDDRGDSRNRNEVKVSRTKESRYSQRMIERYNVNRERDSRENKRHIDEEHPYINASQERNTLLQAKRRLQHKQIAKVLSADNEPRHKYSKHHSYAHRSYSQRFKSKCFRPNPQRTVTLDMHETATHTSKEISFFLDNERDIHGAVIRQSTV